MIIGIDLGTTNSLAASFAAAFTSSAFPRRITPRTPSAVSLSAASRIRASVPSVKTIVREFAFNCSDNFLNMFYLPPVIQSYT